MNTVTFPGLGLEFTIRPGGLFHWNLSNLLVRGDHRPGVLPGGVVLLLAGQEVWLKADDILDMILFAAPGGIIGARIYYIVFNPGLYLNDDGSLNIMACLDIHRGGLAIYGGIIAGVIIAFLVARYKKIPFLALADVCAFGLLIGQIAGRWGNFMNAEAHGGPTDLHGGWAWK